MATTSISSAAIPAPSAFIPDAEVKSTLLIQKRDALQTATASVSFWGVRMVKVGDNEQTLSSLVQDTQAFIKENILVPGQQKADLTQEGRVAALDIMRSVDDLTAKADQSAAEQNLFTRILSFIGRVLFGKPQINLDVVNPFNEGTTRLMEIRARMDLSEEEYSNEALIMDLQPYFAAIYHATWVADGARDHKNFKFGEETFKANPRDALVKAGIDRICSYATVAEYLRQLNQDNIPVSFR